jgi:fructose-bisphosphate aldolase class 1
MSCHVMSCRYQKARNGTQFVDILLAQGIYPGIKVDTGLQVGASSMIPYPHGS